MRDTLRVDSIRVVAIVVSVVLTAAACDPPLGAPTVPDDVVVPTTIGVIAEFEPGDNGVLAVLDDGRRVPLPAGARDLTGRAEVGRLLIVGEGGHAAQDGGVWYAAVAPWSQDCFRIVANGEVLGDRMALSEGFSLPLSDDWDESETSFVETPVRGFCLDDSGAVVRPYS